MCATLAKHVDNGADPCLNLGGIIPQSACLPIFRDFEIYGKYSGFANLNFSSFNDFENLGV